MSEEQQFCLRWNNFQANFTSQFEALRTAEEFVDVTLACDGQRLQAHRLVLSACSPYFKELFRSNPCKHPILFLRDVEFCHLQSLVEFMYAGEVNVAQAQLSTFLQTAEALQIRGLTEAPQRHKEIQGHKRKQFSHTENYSSPEEDNVEDNDDDDDDEVLCISSPSTNSPPAKMMRNMNESYDEFNTAQSAQPRVSLKHVVQLAAQKSHLMLQNQEIEAFQEEGCETFQPKIEAPDYNSDEECKTENSGVSGSFIGLDNSLEMNNTMTAVQGGAEILPGNSSQNFMDVSQDLTQADLRKLHSLDPRPCPICFRMYSNLSNLRQHVRLIHNPQTVVCPLCNKPFKTKLYLKRHLMGFHEISNISTVKSSQPQGRQTDMSESSRSIQRLVSNTSSKEKVLNLFSKSSKNFHYKSCHKSSYSFQFPNESEEHNVPFQNKTVYSNVQQSKDVPPMYISSQQYNDKDNRPLVAQSNRNYNDAQTQMCSTNTESYVPELMKLQNSSCCSNNRNDNNNIDTLNCNRVVFHDLSEKTQQDLSQYSNPAITSINKVQDENMYSNCMTNCAGAEKPHSVGSEVHVSHFLSQEPEEDNTSSANKCNEISYFTSVLEYNKNDQSCNTVHTLDQK